MRKSLIFAAGFATAFAIPLSRAFITGMHIGIARAKQEQKEKEAIAQYHLHTVN